MMRYIAPVQMGAAILTLSNIAPQAAVTVTADPRDMLCAVTQNGGLRESTELRSVGEARNVEAAD
jgi:phosphate-selective porin